jgi:uncharacterized protein YkwD
VPSLDPSGPPATWYLSPAHVPVDANPIRQKLAEALAQVAAEAHLPPPVRDGRLDAFADDLARTTPYESEPAFELVDFLLAYYGVPEPEVELQFGRADPKHPEQFIELSRTTLETLLREPASFRVGIGVFQGPEELSVVLGLQRLRFELKPVPRALAPGLVARIEGRLYAGYREPQIVATLGDGTVTDVKTHGTGGRFEAAITCRADRRGPLQIEVAAESDRGPVVLGNFPIFCGVDPPVHSPTLVLDVGSPADPEVVEKQLLTLVNRDRTARGLPPVRLDRRLTEVARAYSREMADTGVVAHVSPRSGRVDDRLRRARIGVVLVGENVGRDYSAAGAERGFMMSPGHRSNIIEPRMTEVGIGVARGRETGTMVPLFITQIFVAGLE